MVGSVRTVRRTAALGLAVAAAQISAPKVPTIKKGVPLEGAECGSDECWSCPDRASCDGSDESSDCSWYDNEYGGWCDAACGGAACWNCVDETACDAVEDDACDYRTWSEGLSATDGWCQVACGPDDACYSCEGGKTCEAHGCLWEDGYCSRLYECGADSCWSCVAEDECGATDGACAWELDLTWGGGAGYCVEVYECAADSCWACDTGKEDCEAAGCTYDGRHGQCSYLTECSADWNCWACDEAACSIEGCAWSGTYCDESCAGDKCHVCSDDDCAETEGCSLKAADSLFPGMIAPFVDDEAGGDWSDMMPNNLCVESCGVSTCFFCDEAECDAMPGCAHVYGHCVESEACDPKNCWACDSQTCGAEPGCDWAYDRMAGEYRCVDGCHESRCGSCASSACQGNDACVLYEGDPDILGAPFRCADAGECVGGYGCEQCAETWCASGYVLGCRVSDDGYGCIADEVAMGCSNFNCDECAAGEACDIMLFCGTDPETGTCAPDHAVFGDGYGVCRSELCGMCWDRDSCGRAPGCEFDEDAYTCAPDPAFYGCGVKAGDPGACPLLRDAVSCDAVPGCVSQGLGPIGKNAVLCVTDVENGYSPPTCGDGACYACGPAACAAAPGCVFDPETRRCDFDCDADDDTVTPIIAEAFATGLPCYALVLRGAWSDRRVVVVDGNGLVVASAEKPTSRDVHDNAVCLPTGCYYVSVTGGHEEFVGAHHFIGAHPCFWTLGRAFEGAAPVDAAAFWDGTRPCDGEESSAAVFLDRGIAAFGTCDASTPPPVPAPRVVLPGPPTEPCKDAWVAMRMFDAWGDGWEGDGYEISAAATGERVASGTLKDGVSGVDFMCLPPGCYDLRVSDGGGAPDELSWSLGALTDIGGRGGFENAFEVAHLAMGLAPVLYLGCRVYPSTPPDDVPPENPPEETAAEALARRLADKMEDKVDAAEAVDVDAELVMAASARYDSGYRPATRLLVGGDSGRTRLSASGAPHRLLRVASDGSATLRNLLLEKGDARGGAEAYGGCLYVEMGAIAVLEAVTLKGCHASHGGAAFAAPFGLLALTRDTRILDCVAEYSGGGVAVGDDLFVHDSSIENCHALGGHGGGAIYSYAEARRRVPVHLSRARIEDCSAAFVGGAIYSKGLVALDAKSVIRRCGARVGGGLFVPGTAWLGGGSKIEDCAATKDGGGVRGPAVLLNCSSIERCSAESGGAVFLDADDSLVVGDGAIIQGNDATRGAGVYAAGGAVLLRDGAKIADNVATMSGGAVLATAGARVRVKAAALLRNEARTGGGVALEGGAAAYLYTGARLEGNRAADGGGVHAGSGILSIHGGVALVANAALGDGGAIYAGGSARVYASGSGCRFVEVVLAAGDALACELAHETVCDAVDLLPDDRWAVLAGGAADVHVKAGDAATACAPVDVGHTFSAFDATSEGWRGRTAVLTFPQDGRSTTTLAVPTGSHATSVSFALPGDETRPRTPSFEGNDAGGRGGALFLATGAAAFVDGARLEGNTAKDSGGAVGVGRVAQFEANNSLFLSNRARSGGAVYGDLLATLVLEASFAVKNAARTRGGAVAVRGGTLKIDRCFFQANAQNGTASGGGGGALAILDAESATIFGAQFAENAAAGDGGAILVDGGAAVVSGQTTFANNRAGGGGGGVAATRGSRVALDRAPCRNVSVVVDWRRTDASCLPSAFLGVRGITCDAWTVEGTKACENEDKAFDCRGCACGFGATKARYFTVSRGGAEVARGTPVAAALRRYDFCVEPGEIEVRAFDDFGDSWFGGTFSVAMDGEAPVRGARVKKYASEPRVFSATLEKRVAFTGNEASRGGALFTDGADLWEPDVDARGNAAVFGDDVATAPAALAIEPRPSPLALRSGRPLSPALTVTLVDAGGRPMAADDATAVEATLAGETQCWNQSLV